MCTMQQKQKPKRNIVLLQNVVKTHNCWYYRASAATPWVLLKSDDVLSMCPTCGSKPIKWSGIRGKRQSQTVWQLRCNRQGLGRCEYHNCHMRDAKRPSLLRPQNKVSVLIQNRKRKASVANNTSYMTPWRPSTDPSFPLQVASGMDVATVKTSAGHFKPCIPTASENPSTPPASIPNVSWNSSAFLRSQHAHIGNPMSGAVGKSCLTGNPMSGAVGNSMFDALAHLNKRPKHENHIGTHAFATHANPVDVRMQTQMSLIAPPRVPENPSTPAGSLWYQKHNSKKILEATSVAGIHSDEKEFESQRCLHDFKSLARPAATTPSQPAVQPYQPQAPLEFAEYSQQELQVAQALQFELNRHRKVIKKLSESLAAQKQDMQALQQISTSLAARSQQKVEVANPNLSLPFSLC